MANTFWRFFVILFISGLFLLFSLGGVGSKLFRDHGLIPPNFVHSSERIMRRAVKLSSANKEKDFNHFARVIETKRQSYITVLDEYGNIYGSDEKERAEFYRYNYWDTQELPIYRAQMFAANVKIVDKYEMNTGNYIAIIHHKDVGFLMRLRSQLLYTLFFGLVFITLGSLLLARYVVKPLRELQSNVSTFSETQDSSERKNTNMHLIKRQDAIGDLARSYDVMSQQVADVLQSQKLALHALSHELRTPLTRLALMASMAEDDVSKTPQLVQRIETEIQRMNRLIGRISQLARLESGVQAIHTQPFVIKSLVSECLASFELELLHSNMTVIINELGDEDVNLQVDKGLLMIALSNVIKNALSYANNQVTITLHKDTAGFNILIEDDGAGIDGIDNTIDINQQALPVMPSQLHTIFDAFYHRGSIAANGSQNGNASRDSNGGASSNLGLGLSIVHRIMSLHQGKVAAYKSHLGGLAIRLFLPI